MRITAVDGVPVIDAREGMPAAETWLRFLAATERMRLLQRAYFRTRAPSALAAARRGEAEADSLIEEINAELRRAAQPELAGGKR